MSNNILYYLLDQVVVHLSINHSYKIVILVGSVAGICNNLLRALYHVSCRHDACAVRDDVQLKSFIHPNKISDDEVIVHIPKLMAQWVSQILELL